ncbi:hypothetical protein [Rhizobium etli]|uniref:Uncharacterized protein n=1 Tax=Rhizobium etli TaxID=29449 RepID=A0A7W6Y855_RHIET|nr:hypothetical protein [Rhizobium etli]MBB4480834.1 hypothetical protein [Rhizobium etli]MBB4536916.1 hypothetical protein [Rhizobium etli]
MVLTAGHFENVDVVGLAIGRSNATQNHIGFLYLSDTGPRMLHLAWHHRLRNDNPYDDPWRAYVWADFNLEDEENRSALAAVVATVWINHTEEIPYGFSYEGSAFNADGSFVPPPIGQGLTCSTFVVKVISSAGFDLLDMTSWQDRDGDAEWRLKIVGWLEGTDGVDKGHIDALREDVNAMRIRPEDVIAAGTSSPWPVDFGDANVIAQQVLAELYEKVPLGTDG